MPQDMKANWYASRAGDGHNRSHVPAMPLWTGIIRVVQLVLALILLILTAYSASKLGSGVPGFGMTWFTFAWTLLYFIWLGVTVLMYPTGYHPYAHVAVEALTNIFWLTSWAILASEAASSNVVYNYYGYSSSYLNDYYDRYLDQAIPGYKSAVDSLKAAAALGALEWVLFCVTLGFLIVAILSQRKSTGPHVNAEAGVSTEPKLAAAPAVAPAAAVEMHNGVHQQQPPVQPQYGPQYPQQGYPQQGYPQQQPYQAPMGQGYQQPAQQPIQQQPVHQGTPPPAQGQVPYPQ